MKATTQQGVQTSMEPMYIMVRVYHLDLHQTRLKGAWYMDTSIFTFKSILVNTVANVYTQGKFFKNLSYYGTEGGSTVTNLLYC